MYLSCKWKLGVLWALNFHSPHNDKFRRLCIHSVLSWSEISNKTCSAQQINSTFLFYCKVFIYQNILMYILGKVWILNDIYISLTSSKTYYLAFTTHQTIKNSLRGKMSFLVSLKEDNIFQLIFNYLDEMLDNIWKIKFWSLCLFKVRNLFFLKTMGHWIFYYIICLI